MINLKTCGGIHWNRIFLLDLKAFSLKFTPKKPGFNETTTQVSSSYSTETRDTIIFWSELHRNCLQKKRAVSPLIHQKWSNNQWNQVTHTQKKWWLILKTTLIFSKLNKVTPFYATFCSNFRQIVSLHNLLVYFVWIPPPLYFLQHFQWGINFPLIIEELVKYCIRILWIL